MRFQTWQNVVFLMAENLIWLEPVKRHHTCSRGVCEQIHCVQICWGIRNPAARIEPLLEPIVGLSYHLRIKQESLDRNQSTGLLVSREC